MTIEELAAYFDEVVDLGGMSLKEDAVLGEDVPVDSRDMLRILSRIEASQRVRFPPQEILQLRTVGDVARMAERHVRR